MKPKEEAKRLVEIYLRIEDDTVFYWEPYYDTNYSDEEILTHAKKCALICVDRIMLELSLAEIDDYERDLDFNGTYYGYWREVKQQINKYEIFY